MTAGTLTKYFDRISEAPDAVPRLRRFILDLAVRGKLVEQDPDNEPVGELLTRIQAEKARLVKEGVLKKLSSSLECEASFELPLTWEWCCLGDIAEYGIPCKVASNSEIPEDLWVLDLEDIEKGTSRLLERVLSSSRPFLSTKTAFKQGDVLFGKLRPYLNKVLVANTDGVCSTEIVPIRGYCGIVPEYIKLVLKSPLTMERVDRLMYGMKMPRLRTGDAVSLNFPLPPLAEQHRIVAKVDELMALCDQLEAARTEREARRDRLVTASLHRIGTATAMPVDARFHLDHLTQLSTRPAHTRQLRQTILSLAVRGSLTSPNPNDEPVASLLKQIQTEKVRLENEGETKKEKRHNALIAYDPPFDIPPHWNWVRLGELTELITKGSSPKWQGVSYTSKQDGVLFITSENVGNYCLRKLDQLKYVEQKFNDIELRSILQHGDILMNLVGASIGRTAIYNLHDLANINQAVALIRLVRHNANIDSAFLLHYLNSPAAIQLMVASQVVTAQPNISLTNAREFPIPFPPLAEQHRIVAKVDELMTLCDQLEAQLDTTETDSRCLLEAVLRDALTPPL